MNVLFLNVLALVLLLAGPIVGFEIARHRREPGRLRVLAWCTGLAAAAGTLFVAMVLITGLADVTARGFASSNLRFVSGYALFGFLLGVAGLLGRPARLPRLVVSALVLAGLFAANRAAVNAATHQPPEPGASGVVFGPDSMPAAGAPLFLDRGAGKIERLTTDRTGAFHLARGWVGAPQPLLLICVRGGVPFVARPIEYLLTPVRYDIAALPPRAMVTSGIKGFGWRGRIPHECLIGTLEE